MKSAALYIRCARPSAASVKRQKDRCIQFATRQGFLVSETHIYVDYGVSGRRFTLERTGLMSLREEISLRSFQAVVVEDLSRLSRCVHDLAGLLKEFSAEGVQLIEVVPGPASVGLVSGHHS